MQEQTAACKAVRLPNSRNVMLMPHFISRNEHTKIEWKAGIGHVYHGT